MVDAAFYTMLINSEHEDITLSVSGSSCLWHDEYIYHFTRVMQIQESCLGHASLMFRRNTSFWFAFDVTCIPGLWNRLFPVQASWLWIWAWKMSGLEWAETNAMNFMSFKEEVTLHQQENSFFIYGQYGHSVQEWMFEMNFLTSATCFLQFTLRNGLSTHELDFRLNKIWNLKSTCKWTFGQWD